MRNNHAMCDIPAVKWAMEDIPADVRDKGYLSRFIDTTYSVPLDECYSPSHPMGRRKCLKYRSILMGYMKDLNLITGSEDCMEAGVPYTDYCEGMMSPGYYRNADCGRYITAKYTGDKVEDNSKKFMMDGKYRVPLWELVYGDCMVSYWYWGDSSNSCPEYIPRRDLLNALYGTPPMYNVTVSQWEEYKEQIKESYKRAGLVALHTSAAEMLSFEYLTADKMVQKTVFEGGVSIVANFGETPYTLPDGKVVQPVDKVVYGIEGA